MTEHTADRDAIAQQAAGRPTAEQSAQGQPRLSLRFSARDLLSTAIFAVIFIVVGYAIGMFGIISPVTWLLAVPIGALVNGITFMLFLTRVKHAGMVTLFALIVSLFYLIGGNHLYSTVGIVVIGVLADLVLSIGRYRSRWAAIWSYTVMGLAYGTPFVPLFIDRDSYFNAANWEQLGQEYRAGAEALLSPQVVGLFALVLILACFLGGLLGSAMLKTSSRPGSPEPAEPCSRAARSSPPQPRKDTP